jgi:putative transposase
MARPKRLKLKDEEGFFHIMSRTVGQEFYLGDVEKERKKYHIMIINFSK